MKLTVPDRIALLNVLPVEGNVITLRIVRELQTRLGFTETELEHYKIQNNVLPDGSLRITWNPELSNETKDIEVGEAAKGVIKSQLKRLDTQGKLHASMLPLYEKFVEEKQ